MMDYTTDWEEYSHTQNYNFTDKQKIQHRIFITTTGQERSVNEEWERWVNIIESTAATSINSTSDGIERWSLFSALYSLGFERIEEESAVGGSYHTIAYGRVSDTKVDQVIQQWLRNTDRRNARCKIQDYLP